MPVIPACGMMCCLFSNSGRYWHRNIEDVNLEQYPRWRCCGPSKRRVSRTWHSVRAQKTWTLNFTSVERPDVALEVVQLKFCLVGTSVVASGGSKPFERVGVAPGLLLPCVHNVQYHCRPEAGQRTSEDKMRNPSLLTGKFRYLQRIGH